MPTRIKGRSVQQALERWFVVSLAVTCCLFCWTAAVATAQNVSSSIKLPPMEAPVKMSYYPVAAAKVGIQARVLVEFTISGIGKVDNVNVLVSEPDSTATPVSGLPYAAQFDNSVRTALKDVKFEVPNDWESSGAALHRFQLSYVFKIDPCPASRVCVEPLAHESADDWMVISIQPRR
jgi:outer membrane biosynthesis protein TonB